MAEIVGRKFDGSGSNVLLESMQLGRARYRHNPGLLRKQPSERDLRRRRLFLYCKLAQHIHQGLVRSPILFAETRNDVTEIRLVEFRILVDLASKEALPQRAEGNESDP